MENKEIIKSDLKTKSFFNNSTVLLWGILTLAAPLLGIVFVFYNQSTAHIHYDDPTVLNSCLFALFVILTIPGFMWISLYKKSADTCTLEKFISSIKRLRMFYVCALVFAIVVCFSYIVFEIIVFVLLKNSSTDLTLSWEGIILSLLVSIFPLFLVILGLLTAVIISYLSGTYKFVKISETNLLCPSSRMNPSKKFIGGLNIFIAVVFLLSALCRVFKITMPNNYGGNYATIDNFLFILITACFGIKHILEGIIEMKYSSFAKEYNNAAIQTNEESAELSPPLTNFLKNATPASEDKICPNCGEAAPTQNSFCEKCGTKL